MSFTKQSVTRGYLRPFQTRMVAIVLLLMIHFCFFSAAKSKPQKCPLHAKKVSTAISKLKSQKECRFLSILVPVKDKDVPALAEALAENTVSPPSPYCSAPTVT